MCLPMARSQDSGLDNLIAVLRELEGTVKTKLFSGTIAALLSCSLIACTSKINFPQSTAPKPNQSQADHNLIALFLIKKDNLKNEFSGELYPLALYINNQYVDASLDITTQVQANFEIERLIEINQSKSLLQAIREYTVVDGTKALGQFAIENLGVGQFACSSLLIGQGQFTSKQSVQSLYYSLPEAHSGGFSGSIGNQEFDQTWRWAIATSRYTPPLAQSEALAATNLDQASVRQDLLSLGEPLIQQSNEKVSTDAAVVESVSVFDLDHDGEPEVLGKLRKGTDQSVPPDQVAQSNGTTVYANVWLSYRNKQPILISSQITAYEFPVTRTPYDVAGTLDVNGDATEEVIVRNNGYESTSFSIYQLNETELKQVFVGAEFGC